MKKTVKGIHLDLNPALFSDVKTVELMSKIMVPLPEDGSKEERMRKQAERIQDILAFSRHVFGKDYDRIYGIMAKRGGGYVDFDEWTRFLNDVVGEYQKNSDARSASGGKQGRARG